MFLRKAKPFPFLDLPADIRVIIYSFVLEWPSLSQAYSKAVQAETALNERSEFKSSLPACLISRHYPKLITPSILLLNRQIHGEALDELCKIPLVIDAPPPHVSKTSRYFEISDFISERLLQRCRRVVLSINEELTPEEDLRNASGDVEFWQRWDDFLNALFLEIWIYGGHNLKSLVVRIGGAPSAGWEDWDPNLCRGHWLAHNGCRRYREKVLLLLRDGIRSLGVLNEVRFEGPKGDGLNYLLGDALAGNYGPGE